MPPLCTSQPALATRAENNFFRQTSPVGADVLSVSFATRASQHVLETLVCFARLNLQVIFSKIRRGCRCSLGGPTFFRPVAEKVG